MYRVVLIDDEAWSLESILNLVEWKQYGYGPVRTFTDSEEAFDYIRETRPEVIFTDIRMPVLSGLQLMNKAAAEGLREESFYIVISGYGEFEYAKEALQLGAYDYCLKPVDPGSLEGLLKRLRRELDNMRIRRDGRICRALLSPQSHSSRQLSRWGIPLEGETWQAFLLLDRSEDAGPLPDLPEESCLALYLDRRRFLLLAAGEGMAERLAAQGLDRRYLIGCSQPARSPEALAALIREAEMAACRYFIDPALTRGILLYTGKNLNTVKGFAENIAAQMTAGDHAGAAAAIRGIPGLLADNGLGMQHVIYLFNELVSIFARSFDNESAKASYMDCNQLVGNFPDCRALSEYLRGIIVGNCEPGNGSDDNNIYINMSFRNLLEYVDAHYTEALSLKELAQGHFISFSYCCYLFKKSTGKTFSEYLMEKRMDTAYRMLQTGRHSIPEVSAQVGYSDQYYFCKRFKRYFGFAPSRVLKRR